MAYQISVDTGGTFTDVVVADPSGELHVAKALTDLSRAFTSVEAALSEICDRLGIGSVAEMLSSTAVFNYATTRSTNAILEQETGTTVFITTKGFRDTLMLREGGKPNAYDFATPFPRPYVPSSHTFEVDERVTAEGDVLKSLDEEEARTLLEQVKELNPDAIGVSLLWAIVNSSHEERLGALVTEILSGVPVTLSHRINPIVREYRRASSTVIDASLKPVMQRHLETLRTDLYDVGFQGELVAATSFGGVMPIEDLVDRPIYSARGGPSMAPVAGQAYGGMELDARNIIVCDTGGTSFDVSMVVGGEVEFAKDTWLGDRFLGHITGLSSVDARSIGAGGGSVAWVDDGSLLRVGPHSAGSEPGPSAYGRGGTEPTVTDAAVVLGYLNPTNFLGGRMQLDVDAALTSMESIAQRLSMSVDEAASGVMKVAGEATVQAVQEMAISKGVVVTDALIVAGGGAAGLNIAKVCAELGVSKLLIPRTAGALSACGSQYSDMVYEKSATHFADTANFAFERVNATLISLDNELAAIEDSLKSRGVSEFSREFSVEARYRHQNWELETQVPNKEFKTQDDVDAVHRNFDSIHERVYAVSDPHSEVEFVSWKGRLTATARKPTLRRSEQKNAPLEPHSKRNVFFETSGRVSTKVYRGDECHAGGKLVGPAIIEEPTTTIVVYPGMTATVTAFKNYLIEIG